MSERGAVEAVRPCECFDVLESHPGAVGVDAPGMHAVDHGLGLIRAVELTKVLLLLYGVVGRAIGSRLEVALQLAIEKPAKS